MNTDDATSSALAHPPRPERSDIGPDPDLAGGAVATATALRLVAARPDYEAFEVVDLPLPALRADEVRVAMRAFSLNRRDLNIAGGLPGWQVPAGRIPLSDGVGEVVAVGAEVRRFAVGDRVSSLFWPEWHDGPIATASLRSLGGGASDGVARTLWQTRAEALSAVPEYLDDEEAATLPCAALTAWNALTAAQPAPGDTVVVQGTGGVALFALQIAHRLGLRALVVTARPQETALLQRLGADRVIERGGATPWDRAVLDATGGRGADLVLDPVGGRNFEASLRATRVGGGVALFGALDGQRASFDPALIWEKALTVRSVSVGSRAQFETMLRAFERWRLRPLIAARHDWRDLAAAMRAMDAATAPGKRVLTVGPRDRRG